MASTTGARWRIAHGDRTATATDVIGLNAAGVDRNDGGHTELSLDENRGGAAPGPGDKCTSRKERR
jgi:hypothetical protein